MNSKKIESNVEFICNLCDRFLNMEINEGHFKQGLCDYELYLTYYAQQYILKYNEDADEYRIFHKNMLGASKFKTAYHLELSAKSLVTTIKKLSTRHVPQDMNSKSKDIVEKNLQRYDEERLAKSEKWKEAEMKREQLLSEIREYKNKKDK